MHHGDHLKVRHWHLNDHQIVDWKSDRDQLNPYRDVTSYVVRVRSGDPFLTLAPFYPADALEEMRSYYGVAA